MPSLRPVSVLVALLKSDDPLEAMQAASEIGYWGPAAGSAVPALMEAFDGSDRYALGYDLTLKNEVADSLALIGLEAVEPLLQRLKSADRTLAIQSLCGIAPFDDRAFQKVRMALNDPHPSIREGAAWVLSACGEKLREAIPELKKAAEDPETAVARAAERALNSIGESTDSSREKQIP